MKHDKMAREILRPVEDDIAQMIEDLEACHVYYCKYNCGTLRQAGEHTPRCRVLQSTYGFEPQERPRVPDPVPTPGPHSPYPFSRSMTEKHCVLCDYVPEMVDNQYGAWANGLTVHFIDRHFGELPQAVVSKIHDEMKREELAR